MQKAVFVLALVLGPGLGSMLGGCAGAAPPRPDWESKTSLTSLEIDADKVATVNRWAMDRGAKLIWINYPQKRLTANDQRGH